VVCAPVLSLQLLLPWQEPWAWYIPNSYFFENGKFTSFLNDAILLFSRILSSICITSVDIFLVIRCFSLFAAVCIVESVGRVHEAVFDAITNIHGIFESIHVATYCRRSGTIHQNVFVSDNLTTGLCEAANVMMNYLLVEFGDQ
jgi:hypothetical protein